MKKLLIVLLVLISPLLIFVLTRLVVCRPDKSVYEVSRPLAEAVVKHTEKHGRPADLRELEHLPYALVSCEKKTKEFECIDYFFVKDGKYYTTYLLTTPQEKVDKYKTIWLQLIIEHDYTINRYMIIDANKIVNINDLLPSTARRSVGACKMYSF